MGPPLVGDGVIGIPSEGGGVPTADTVVMGGDRHMLSVSGDEGAGDPHGLSEPANTESAVKVTSY